MARGPDFRLNKMIPEWEPSYSVVSRLTVAATGRRFHVDLGMKHSSNDRPCSESPRPDPFCVKLRWHQWVNECSNKAFDSRDRATEFRQPWNCVLARMTDIGGPEMVWTNLMWPGTPFWSTLTTGCHIPKSHHIITTSQPQYYSNLTEYQVTKMKSVTCTSSLKCNGPALALSRVCTSLPVVGFPGDVAYSTAAVWRNVLGIFWRLALYVKLKSGN